MKIGFREIAIGSGITLAVAFVSVISMTVWLVCFTPTSIAMKGIASGVTKEGLLSIRVGMTESEVIDLLGPPIEKNERNNEGEFFYSYSQNPHKWTYWAPWIMIWFEDERVRRMQIWKVDLWQSGNGTMLLNLDKNGSETVPEFEFLFTKYLDYNETAYEIGSTGDARD